MAMISVVTATWRRHHLLARAMKSLAAQAYKDWEHIIVSDGCDGALEAFVTSVVRGFGIPYRFRVMSLGRNWHEQSGGKNFGGIPRLVGTYLAAGEYIAYLDDDNEFLPNHLADLVEKLDEGCDFAYGMSEIVRQDRSVESYLGDGNPRFGHIDTSMVMHRWNLIQTANWKGRIYADDWELFEAWIAAGCKVGWVPRVTLRYFRKY